MTYNESLSFSLIMLLAEIASVEINDRTREALLYVFLKLDYCPKFMYIFEKFSAVKARLINSIYFSYSSPSGGKQNTA